MKLPMDDLISELLKEVSPPNLANKIGNLVNLFIILVLIGIIKN